MKVKYKEFIVQYSLGDGKKEENVIKCTHMKINGNFIEFYRRKKFLHCKVFLASYNITNVISIVNKDEIYIA